MLISKLKAITISLAVVFCGKAMAEHGFASFEIPFENKDAIQSATNVFNAEMNRISHYSNSEDRIIVAEKVCKENMPFMVKRIITFKSCLKIGMPYERNTREASKQLQKAKDDYMVELSVRAAEEQQEEERKEEERLRLQEEEEAKAKKAIADEQSVLEGMYGAILQKALLASIDSGDTYNYISGSNCKSEWNDVKHSEENKDFVKTLSDRCHIELNQKFLDFVKTPAFSSKNCTHMAIKKGDKWSKAEINMTYSPYVSDPSQPVWFKGEVLDATSTSMTVYGGPGQNAFIMLSSKNTKMFDRDHVHVGGAVSGFGVRMGGRKVRLLSGAETTATAIAAECVQPVR